jgi:hypothetical protein
MFGYSMKDEDFIKLSHFDRVRRGHYDKIPNILMLLGLSASIHILHANLTSNTPLILAIGMFGIGIYLKQWFVEKDDKELAGMKKEIEIEFRKREQERNKGRKK